MDGIFEGLLKAAAERPFTPWRSTMRPFLVALPLALASCASAPGAGRGADDFASKSGEGDDVGGLFGVSSAAIGVPVPSCSAQASSGFVASTGVFTLTLAPTNTTEVVLAPVGTALRVNGFTCVDSAGAPIDLTVKRGTEAVHVNVTPRVPEGEKKPRIGIMWDDRGVTVLEHPNPLDLVAGSVRTMIDTLSAVLSPRSDIKAEHLSGPVGIMRIYYLLFESPDGWRLALWFSVVLNVNLALLNLLPVPVLDGGHITLAIIEAIRRKPINVRVLEIVQSGFAMLIIGYMLYVTFFDVQDLPWRGKKEEPAAELKFTPAPKQAE